MAKQFDFFSMNREFAPGRFSHGSDDIVGKRKVARPFKKNFATHVVFKSENAKGKLNLLTPRNQLVVDDIVHTQAKKFGVKIHAEQNVRNHLHYVLSCGSRERFSNFLRAVAGLIARFVLGGAGKFWTQLPFTRLIHGRRDYLKMLAYVAKNAVEARFGKSAREKIEADEDRARKERRRLKRREVATSGVKSDFKGKSKN